MFRTKDIVSKILLYQIYFILIYNMNILQGLKTDTTYCVTLNQTEQIDKSKILRSFVYYHPVFNKQSMAAQQQRDTICGTNHTHFCGAYWYNGFHEDGVKSALNIANKLKVDLSWVDKNEKSD